MSEANETKRPRVCAEDAERFGVPRELRLLSEAPASSGLRMLAWPGRRYKWVHCDVRADGLPDWRVGELRGDDLPIGWVAQPEDDDA